MSDTATPIEFIVESEDGGSPEVFKGANWEEVAKKLGEAKKHATAKIRSQADELRGLKEENTPPATTPPTADGDEYSHAHYLSLLQTDARKANAYLQKFPESWDPEVRSHYTKISSAAMAAERQQVNASFARKHPELLQVTPEEDVKNSQAISKVLTELYPDLANANGVYTEKQLEAAFNQAKADGLLKLPGAQATTTSSAPETGTVTVTVPSVMTTTTGSAPVPTDEDFRKWAMDPKTPLDEVKREAERRIQATKAR